jgi:hypothetical protein
MKSILIIQNAQSTAVMDIQTKMHYKSAVPQVKI